MKIIKHGNKYSKNKIAICPLCGCTFKYNSKDAEMAKTLCFTTFPPTYKTYIKCPECDKAIYLNTMIFN